MHKEEDNFLNKNISYYFPYIDKVNKNIKNIEYDFFKEKIYSYINNDLKIQDTFNVLKKYYDYDYSFLNYQEKLKFIKMLLTYAINNNYDEECISSIIEFFNSEKRIKNQRESQNRLIKYYQGKIDEIDSSDSLDSNNIDGYFYCLEEALASYDTKKFGSIYSFYSERMNNTFHEGLSMDLSIPIGELPHLLGMRNPNYDDNDIILNQYYEYLRINNLSHSNDIYYYYLRHHFKNDLKKLINENPNDKRIKEFVVKSFNKCLTFIKIYEYKKIPEIVLDYQRSSGYDITFSEDHTRDLITKAENDDIDRKSVKKLTDIDTKSLIPSDLKLLSLIQNKFQGQLNSIYVSYDSKKGKYDFQKIIVDDIYYRFKKDNYWAELSPDIFLVSYDTKEYEKSHRKLNNVLRKAVKILSAKLKKDLKIKNVQKDSLEDTIPQIEDEKRNRLINLETIKSTMLSLSDEDCKMYESQFDIVDDSKTNNRDRDSINTKDDYENLKLYMESIFKELNENNTGNRVNNYFEIVNSPDNRRKVQEQPHIRMIQRIMDRLLRKSKSYDYPKLDVSIIGFGTIRDKTRGRFRERFAKTLMGKTFLQLEYDLRRNGYSYRINGIEETYKGSSVYYNYDLLIDDEEINKLYENLVLLNDLNKGKTR